eukprot:scaffold11620_cov119-Isochrysis_galbana.AAC.5
MLLTLALDMFMFGVPHFDACGCSSVLCLAYAYSLRSGSLTSGLWPLALAARRRGFGGPVAAAAEVGIQFPQHESKHTSHAHGDEARKAQGGGKRSLHLVFRGRWISARGPSHTPFGGVRYLASTYRRCGANWAPPDNSYSHSHTLAHWPSIISLSRTLHLRQFQC